MFDGVAAFTRFEIPYYTGRGAEKINVEMTGDNYFNLLRVPLALGRPPRAAGEVVLSNDFWRARFSADPNVLGRTFGAPAASWIVVGVAAPGFRGTLQDYLGDPKLWLSLHSQPLLPFLFSFDLRHDWALNFFVGAARLRPGVTVEQAQLAVSAIERRNPLPAGAAPRSARLFPSARANFHPSSRARVERTLAFCAGLSALLLLLGCLNAGLFLFGKALAETRQSAVQRALGASAAALVRRHFLESAFLCFASIALGTLLAAGCVRLLETWPPPLAFLALKPALDWRVWTLSSAWTALAVLLAAAAPALASLRASSNPLHSADAGASRPARRARELLVACQMAVAAVILIAAGFVLRTVAAAHRLDLGFNPFNLVMSEVQVYEQGLSSPRRASVIRDALARLRGRPEIASAASASLMPLTVLRRPGRLRVSSASFAAFSNTVSHDYFETLQMPLLRGRAFSPGAAGSAETVVNQTLARLIHPQGEAVGKTLEVLDEDARPRLRLLVTGIVRDALYHTLWEHGIPYFYTSSSADPGGNPAIIVRARGDAAQAARALRDTLHSIDPAAVVSTPRTPHSQLASLIHEQSYLAAFFTTLGAIAAVVAAGGLLATLHLMVSQRTREIGIRQALGASRVRILGAILRRGLLVAAAGLIVGALAAGQLERWLRPLAPGTPPADPVALLAAPALLLCIAAACAAAPALRAARIQPWSALRHPE